MIYDCSVLQLHMGDYWHCIWSVTPHETVIEFASLSLSLSLYFYGVQAADKQQHTAYRTTCYSSEHQTAVSMANMLTERYWVSPCNRLVYMLDILVHALSWSHSPLGVLTVERKSKALWYCCPRLHLRPWLWNVMMGGFVRYFRDIHGRYFIDQFLGGGSEAKSSSVMLLGPDLNFWAGCQQVNWKLLAS